MRTTPRGLPAALAIALTACLPIVDPPPPRDLSIGAFVHDFQTAVGSEPLLVDGEPVPFGLAIGRVQNPLEDDDEAFAAALDSGTWLVALSTGQRVGGGVRRGYIDLDGVVHSYPFHVYSFVPEEPLEEGWYVLAIERASVAEFGPLTWGRAPNEEGGVQFYRFHLGSRPTWTHAWLTCGEHTPGSPSCVASVDWSEPVEVLGDTRIEVLASGVAVACTTTLYLNAIGASLECPYRVPDGVEWTLRVGGSVLTDANGTPSPEVSHVGFIAGPVVPRFGIDIALAAR
jgi:hypothetical protein